MILKREPILASLALLLVSVGIFLAAFAARITFLPNVVPIAAVEESQSLLVLELAFLLRAIENIAGFGTVVVLVALAASWIGRKRQLPSPESQTHRPFDLHQS
jgi:H+/gluconate symporter-like permease